MPLPRSVGFDTLSGHLPVFPDYLATDCMFIDWELIKRGPPLISPPLPLRKVRLPLMWERYFVRQHKRICCSVSFAPSPLFCIVRAVQWGGALWVSLWLLLSLLGGNWRCKKKQMSAITHITCRQSGWLYSAVSNADVQFCRISLHLAVFMCLRFHVFMCRIVTARSLDLFICCLLYLCLPLPPPSFPSVCPHDSQYADSIPHQLIVFCLRPCKLLPLLFILALPQTQAALCDFLSLPLAVCISPPSTPPNSTEPAVVSNQNNIFKNAVNITPTNSEGLLVGYSCIQVYIVSWWRCIRRTGEPNMAIPSNFDVFIHSH